MVDAGFQSINYKGNKVTGFAGNGSSTSQLNFRGKENLGGGLMVDFRVETDWNMASNAGNTGTPSGINVSPGDGEKSINSSGGTFGNGELRLGLTGSLGRVDFGAVNYTTLDATLAGQPFGTAIGSGFRTIYVNDAQANSSVRGDNSFKYTSPNISGLTFTVYKVMKQTKATVVATPSAATGLAGQPNAFGPLGAYDYFGVQEVGLKYNNGPFNAVFTNLTQDWVGVQATNSSNAAAGTAKFTINTLGMNYMLTNDLKLFLLNQGYKGDVGGKNNRTTTASASYFLGAYTWSLQAGGTRAADGTRSSFTGVGVDYALSKTTALYARSESVNDAAKTVQPAVGSGAQISGPDTKFGRTAFGLRMAY